MATLADRLVVRTSVLLALATLAAAVPAAARSTSEGQGATAISGVVVDSAGGVVPGATALVTNTAGAKFEAVTNHEGIFNVPAITAGTYVVEVSLGGFKTYRTEVRAQPGLPAALNITLEVGAL